MESIQLALRVVFPLFAMMAVGYAIKQAGWVDEITLTKMNSITFRVFLSCLIFINIYTSNITEIFTVKTLKLIVMTWLCVLVFIFAPMRLLKRSYPDIRRRSVMTQGIYRGNLVLFGIPVAAAIGGDQASATAAVLIAAVVPLFNLTAVILLERARSKGADFREIIIKILKNPLIIASALGLFFGILQIKIPETLLSPVESLSRVGTPLAFVILGASLNLREFTADLKPMLLVCIGKLILEPAAVFFLAYLLGFGKLECIALVGAMASPTAVSSFSMAKEMEVDSELAGQIVVLTSVLSVVTLFFWVAGLRTAGMI